MRDRHGVAPDLVSASGVFAAYAKATAVGEARMRENLRRTEFRSYFFPCSSA
jgi:hypothetical protein